MALLDGKAGIITGAASGIGAATARTLAREGARLVLTDLDDAAGSALAEEIGGIYLHHDVAGEEGWPAVIAAAESYGRLDIMMANAGIGIMGSAIDFGGDIHGSRAGGLSDLRPGGCLLSFPNCNVNTVFSACEGTRQRSRTALVAADGTAPNIVNSVAEAH